MNINERLDRLRQLMSINKDDIYVIVTGDYHQSEYTGAYFNTREFMSGFTGSAGTLVVTMTESALFTDGRYFVQAAHQLEGTEIELVRMGTKGAPTVIEYIYARMPSNGRTAFDGRVVEAYWGLELQERLRIKNATIEYNKDLVEEFWEDRPQFPDSKAFVLEEKYAGESTQSKLTRLRAKMYEYGALVHVIATLDDICWLYNIRGNDVECNPVVMAYSVITQESAMLFINADKLDEKVSEYLTNCDIIVKTYDSVYQYMENLQNTTLLIDRSRVNYYMYMSINSNVTKLLYDNPTVLMKSIKNEVEIANLKNVHIKDGAAVTRFMYWLKTNMANNTDDSITEITAADYLLKCRQQQDGFIELSFETISAYNANAAMMHYSAKRDKCAKLEPCGMLLVDSGGQYYEGTTDVTRNIALGNVTPDMKKNFTLTLKGMLNLTHAKFLYGCTGFNLDILARGALWNEGIDYRCGTGHGIGYLLNVHESPNGFRWKHNPGYNDLCVIEEGMVTSNEPGVYIEGEYGIRIENEIVCKKLEENEYGQFMGFDTFTLVPIDLDIVDTQYLDEVDIKRLNDYHVKVYEALATYMNDEEREWLKRYTRPISK